MPHDTGAAMSEAIDSLRFHYPAALATQQSPAHQGKR